jgi:YVTN family beta-propeller protein
MDRIYCANAGSDNVSVIDARSNLVIATVATGHQPRALLYDFIYNKVYCANSGSDDVTVIDGATDSVICTIAAGNYPFALVHNPLRSRVYVANRDDSSVSVLRDSGGGIEDCSRQQASSRKLAATVVRELAAGAIAFDAMGGES